MVDSSGLENRQAGNGLEGSNPSLSARRKMLTSLSSGHFASCKEVVRTPREWFAFALANPSSLPLCQK